MISGSFAMSLIFCKEPFYDDFDLYFSKKSDLKNAIKLLDTSLEFKKISKTKHALTYLHEKKKKKLQLILKLRKSLYHLATGHDFINCSVAYSSKNNNFWISKNAYSIWRNKELEIQKTPLQNKNIPDIYYFNTYAILLQRVNKYKQRYGLSLSKKVQGLVLSTRSNSSSRFKYLF